MTGRIKFGTNEYANRPAEVDLCRSGLAKLLALPSLSFREENTGRGVVFGLSGPMKRAAEATGTMYTVLPFLESSGAWFWLAVVLDYALDLGELDFRSASLVLFSGLAESSKEALLRAEWEKLPEPRPHAQPHWHVYFGTVGDSRGPTNESLAILHLAMAATWHHVDPGPEPHYCEPSGRAVVRWIEGCLAYLKTELARLAKKHPL